MSFKGSIASLGMAEILQLLWRQQKSGLLQLYKGKKQVNLGFFQGNIVYIEPLGTGLDKLFGRALIKAELIDDSDLQRLMNIHYRTLKKLNQIILDENLLATNQVQAILNLLCTELAYQVLTWEKGEYNFLAENEEQLSFTRMIDLKVDQVLMEGMRQMDEWPGIRKKIKGEKIIFQKIKDLSIYIPGQQGSTPGDIIAGKGKYREIGSGEKKVFQQVNGLFDVEKLAYITRIGLFETSRALKNLLGADLIKLAKASSRKKAGASHGRKSRITFLSTLLNLSAAAVLILASYMLYDYARSLDEINPFSHYLCPLDQQVKTMTQYNRYIRGRHAIRVYWVEKGKLPTKVDQLTEGGFLKKNLLYQAEFKQIIHSFNLK